MQIARTVCVLAMLATATYGASTAQPQQQTDRKDSPPADKRLGLGLVSSLASASAGLSSSSSSSSSSSGHDPTGYGPPVDPHEGKDFDLWTFKKELLRSVFQLLKALKGGLIAIKGHVLKTKGHILATKGQLLAAKGEAIKNFGKSVAASAFAAPQPSAGYGYPASGHSSGYASSAVGGSHLSYSGPPPPISSSGFGGSFSSPSHLFPPDDLSRVSNTATGSEKTKSLPEGATAGLLILKPVRLPRPAAKSKPTARDSGMTDINVESSNINYGLLPYPEMFVPGYPPLL